MWDLNLLGHKCFQTVSQWNDHGTFTQKLITIQNIFLPISHCHQFQFIVFLGTHIWFQSTSSCIIIYHVMTCYASMWFVSFLLCHVQVYYLFTFRQIPPFWASKTWWFMQIHKKVHWRGMFPKTVCLVGLVSFQHFLAMHRIVYCIYKREIGIIFSIDLLFSSPWS